MRIFLLTIVIIMGIGVTGFAQSKKAKKKGRVEYKEVVQEENKVDTQAMYPGGQKGVALFIQKNIRYPLEAYKAHISGKVIVKLTIGTDSTVNKIEIVESDHALFSEEAKRLFQLMDKWIPAVNNGQPVEITYVYPLTFKAVGS